MPDNLYAKIVELIDRGEPFAVALVLSAQGSTPQGAGVRAIVEPSGRLWGTVGGGMVEAQTLKMAAEACRSGRPQIFECDMSNADSSRELAVCGGTMRVLVDPTIARHRECFAQAARAIADRRRGCLITCIERVPEPIVEIRWQSEVSVCDEAAIPGGDAIRTCLATGFAQRYVTDKSAANATDEVLIEPVVPLPRLVIAGGGHVGHAVAIEAQRVGFEVTVIDDRPEFADAASFPPGIRTVCGPVAKEIAAFPLDADSFVMLLTRGHRHDAEALAECIHRPLAYLGMIGSRRKVALVRRKFLDGGLATEEELDRVRAPIGLDIGAVTVPEIAVSIVAQLIAVRRKGALA
jgi:xanthine dehydrogenase accessory factor